MYGRCDGYGSTIDLDTALVVVPLEFLLTPMPVNPYGQQIYFLQQEYVAVGRVFMARYVKVKVAAEQIRVPAFIDIAARVIFHIFNGSVQLLMTQYDTVMEGMEKSLDFRESPELADGLGACAEEPCQFAAQFPVESGRDVQDDMDMIRHYYKA